MIRPFKVFLRELAAEKTFFLAAVVGTVGGGLGLIYYYVLVQMLHLVWAKGVGVEWLGVSELTHVHPTLLIATTVGGAFVGLSLKLFGAPGEIAAVVDNIHMEEGKIDIRQTPSMVVNSLISITVGGSAGPEAPLVQIIGSFGSWLAIKLKQKGSQVRTLTFCGMGAALGAFFGAPLGGALFALEIPHRKSIEYYEALVPSIIAALCGFFVFKTALGYHGPIYRVSDAFHSTSILSDLSLITLMWGLLMGCLGAVLARIFSWIFRVTDFVLHPLSRFPVLLGAVGGLILGLLAMVAPRTLFWGEFQTNTLIQSAPVYLAHHALHAVVLYFLGIALVKMVAVGVTLHSGFRGGFIFPLFFIGAAVGIAVSAVLPSIPAPISVVCLMAAINIAVTRTPISTVVILGALTGMTLIPVLVVAGVTSFLLTPDLSVIRTQRSRTEVESPLSDPHE